MQEAIYSITYKPWHIIHEDNWTDQDFIDTLVV